VDVGTKASRHVLGFVVQWRRSFGTSRSQQHLKEDVGMLPDCYGLHQGLSLMLETMVLLCRCAPLYHSSDSVTSPHDDQDPFAVSVRAW